VKVHCTAGTYLRSIAHDLGQAYGGGAFLQSLVRTRSADFGIENVWTTPKAVAKQRTSITPNRHLLFIVRSSS